MKISFFIIFLFATSSAYATETIQEKQFHLFSSKCQPESESDGGPETTPQSPPLNIDDPATPGCNNWEINIVTDGDLTPDEKQWDLPLLDMNYGIGDNLQLKYQVPFLNSQAQAYNISSMGESAAGIKYMFYENEDDKLQMAIYPQTTFSNPSSNDVGLTTPGTIMSLPFLMSVKVGNTPKGDVKLTANLGYNISTKEGITNYVTAALGLGMPLSRRISLLGEIATEQAVAQVNADEVRDQLVKANIGALANLNRQIFLFGSVGHSLYSSDQNNHTYVLAGFRFLR